MNDYTVIASNVNTLELISSLPIIIKDHGKDHKYVMPTFAKKEQIDVMEACSKVVCRVEGTTLYVVITSAGSHQVCKLADVKVLLMPYHYFIQTDNGKKLRYAIDDLLTDAGSVSTIDSPQYMRLRSCKLVNNNKMPYGIQESNGKFLFNEYNGIEAKYIKRNKIDNKDLGIILAHIKQIICNGDDNKYEFFLKWCAGLATNPTEISRSALVITGSKGAGKSIIGELIYRMIGDRNAIITSNPDSIVGQFNSSIANKYFVLAEEAIFGKDPRHDQRMKDVITGSKIMVNKKGVSEYTVDNAVSMMIISNDDNCVKITTDERRYALYRVNDEIKNTKDYFIKLVSATKNIDAFYSYLIDIYNPNDVCDIRDIRETGYNHAAIEFMKSDKRFILDAVSMGINCTAGAWDYYVTLTDFYNLYLDHCQRTRESPVCRVIFAKTLRQTGLEAGRKMVGADRLMCIHFGTLDNAIKLVENAVFNGERGALRAAYEGGSIKNHDMPAVGELY